MADFQGKISHEAKNSKNGSILDLAKIMHLDYNLSAGNLFKIVPMANFQGSSYGAKNSKNGSILDLTKILHLDKFDCEESI